MKEKIKEKCSACKKERVGKWALFFGVPKLIEGIEHVVKLHICPRCFKLLTSHFLF